MKKINLNQLSMSWNEKQTPRGIIRYAAMLLMLLTLGVGQMWAWDDSWGTGTTYSDDHLPSWIAYFDEGQNVEVTFNINGTSTKKTSAYSDKNTDRDISASDITTALQITQYKTHMGHKNHNAGQDSNGANIKSNEMGWKVFNPGGTKVAEGSHTGGWIEEDDWKNNEQKQKWGASSFTENLLTGVSASTSSDQTYTLEFWFHATAKWTNSSDVEWGTADHFYYPGNDKNFKYQFVIPQTTLTVNTSGDDGTASASSGISTSITYNTDYSLTASNVTGYDFVNWTTSDANITITSPTSRTGAKVKFTAFSNATITANYAPKTTTVTLDGNAPDGQKVTGGGTEVTATYDAALPSFSALTCTGSYALKGYYDEEEGGNKIINADGSFAANSGTWNRTDGATLTLYAQWSLDRTLTYDGNGNTSGSVPASATTYSNGASVTVLGNTNSLAKTGYTFAGWNTAPDGNGASYAASSSITMNANYTLYAQWSENMTTVTVSVYPTGSGTLTVDDAAFSSGNTVSVGVTTHADVVATAYPGYKFDTWTKSGNATEEAKSSNTYTVGGSGSGSTGTLRADFTTMYAYIEGRFQVKNSARNSTTYTGVAGNGYWATDSRNIKFNYDGTNHRYDLHTYMKPSELSAQLSSNTQYFTIQTSTSTGSLTGGSLYTPASTSPTTNQKLTAAGTATKRSASTTLNREASFWFDSSDETGYVILYFDEAGVWYELEHTLNYNGNGNTSGSVPTSEAYYNNGASATVSGNTAGTPLAKTNYTFGGWNTNQYITGTNYSAGNSAKITTNTTLYAKWTRSITLNANGGGSGSTSVTAAYNCSTLQTSITNPSKDGYTFGGWFTADDGTGLEVINTSKALQASKSGWTDGSGRFTRTADGATLYAKWTQTITLNANTANHGSGSNKTATVILNKTALSSITHCTPATGYQLTGYYTAATGGTKILNADGTFAGSDITVDKVPYTSSGKWVKADATTLYAQYEPITYTVTLKPGLGGSGDPGTMTVDYDATAYKTFSHSITQAGFSLAGWYINNTETKVLEADGTFVDDVDGYISEDGNWVKAANCDLYAHWTGYNFTVRFNANGGSGSLSDQTGFTYYVDKTLTSIGSSIYRDGYQFDGWATTSDGDVVLTDGQTVNHELLPTSNNEIITLYAKWTQVNVTDLTLSPATAAGSTEVTVTPTLSGAPTGTSSICWGLYYDALCTREVAGIEFSENPSSGDDEVTFTTPAYSGSYYIKATYKTGNNCSAGTTLSTRIEQYVVASDHNVTVKYMCGSTEIASRRIVNIPAASSTLIAAPEIIGYYFSSWTAGEGVTITDPTSDEKEEAGMEDVTNVKKVSANYDGTLTINYNRKDLIYFKNTLGWSDVYIHFNGSSYWDATEGTGNYQKANRNKHMTRIGETDVWYFDYGAESITPNNYLVFTDREYSGDGYGNFHGTKSSDKAPVVYPIIRNNAEDVTTASNLGFNAGTPMYVPINQTGVEKTVDDNAAKKAMYYNEGYWREYEPATGATGYTLEIYNKMPNSDRTLLYSIPMTDASTVSDIFEAAIDLEAGTTYGIKFLRDNNMRYTHNDEYLAKNGNYTEFTKQNDNWGACGLTTTVAGNYIFHLACGNDGKLKLAVTYPAAGGDYRLVYTDTQHSDAHPSDIVRKVANGTDIVSFFVRKDKTPSIQIQKCAVDGSGNVSWSSDGYDPINPATAYSSVIIKDGVYNFHLAMNSDGDISISKVEPYTGDFYIRTDAVGGTKWADYRNDAHKMTYSDYAAANKGFTHYYVNWVGQNSNVKFTVANDYSPCISDTLVEDASTIATIESSGKMTSDGANIRYMYNVKDNTIKRAYLAAAQSDGSYFLVLKGQYIESTPKLMDPSGNRLTSAASNNHGVGNDEIQFTDNMGWLYKANVKAVPGGYIKLYAKYNNNYQYFIGDAEELGEGHGEELIGGSGSAQSISVVYDFKIDRMIAAWVPANDEISGEMVVNADIMIVREHQDASQNIVFANEGTNSLSTSKTIYGVMRFNKYVLNNLRNGTSTPLDPGDQLPIRQRNHYYISFPFDVNVSDIFGFGTYGVHWVLQYYDGKARATEGLWADPGMTFWKYVPPTGKLNANEGYLLALSPSQMAASKTGDGEVWENGKEEVELYFPDASAGATISEGNVTIAALSSDYQSKINRENGVGGDRRIADSYWRCVGVPSLADFNNSLLNGSSESFAWTDPGEYTTGDVHFLYEIQWADYSLRAVSGSSYNFKAMHAYMIQSSTAIVWSNISKLTQSVVARRQSVEDIHNYEFRMELKQNGELADQTFVRLTDDENVTNGFEFGQDMSKEMYSTKANIFTYIGYEPVAANSMPFSDGTTVVPVGVKLAADGEYTFSMPEGTNGLGVVLVDTENNSRTSLSALDYTVDLEAGTYENRFFLEISPVHQLPTSIENTGASTDGEIRKVMIDGLMYIVKDGQMFDARGARVQ